MGEEPLQQAGEGRDSSRQNEKGSEMTKIAQCSLGFMLMIGVSLSSGCAHPLVVKNLDRYQTGTANSLTTPLTIGIAPQDGVHGPTGSKLATAIAGQLSQFKANVIMPYIAGAGNADVVASIGVDSKFEGSGWNFLINFPGFLIFTPAWHGYVYEVSHDIHVRLNRGTNNEPIDSFTLPVTLDVRHADINRTWTEISYLEVGVIALVGGILFIDYDDRVTPLLADVTSDSLGKYVAQEIIGRLNKYDGLHDAAQRTVHKRGDGKDQKSTADRLAELKQLKDSGALSEEEYKKKRDELVQAL